MLIEGSNAKYKVQYVRHFSTKRGLATSFSISEKLKQDDKAIYQSYSFAVWDNIDIMDGDYVNILTLESIDVNPKNGKLYVNLSGKVNVIKSDKAQYAEEQAPAFVPTEQKAEELPDIADDEFKLPFDI